MDKLLKLGPYFLVIPFFVYPVIHFLHGAFVASIVPPWIPWPMFWTYFTAVTIIAGGLAIATRKYARQGAILLAIEISLFVVFIHALLLFSDTDNAWAARPIFGDFPARLIDAFKDFGLIGALLIFAGTQSEEWKKTGKDKLFVLGRTILGISIAAFGVIQFLYPGHAPGIPPKHASIPFIIPGEQTWSYLTGVFLLVAGTGIIIGKQKRPVVAWLGIIILAFDLLVWIPAFGINPGELHGNWLKDLGIIGGIFILADSLPKVPEFEPFK